MEEKNFDILNDMLNNAPSSAQQQEDRGSNEPGEWEELPVESGTSGAGESGDSGFEDGDFIEIPADEDRRPPEDFLENFEAAKKMTYKSTPDEPAKARPVRERSLKEKQRLRRLTAMGILVLLALVLIGTLIGILVKHGKKTPLVNIGPLPPEQIDITPVPKYYDYAAPVPAGTAAPGSYLNDALIIGDTRVECLDLYGAGDFQFLLYGSNVDVDDALVYECSTNHDFDLSLEEALRNNDYGKIYLSFGLNELGWSYSEIFSEDYTSLVRAVRQAEPDAVIYLVGLFPITADANDESGYMNNAHILEYNNLIKQIAFSEKVYYLDSASAMADPKGFLNEKYESGGYYLCAEGAEAWVKFFLTHTVDPAEYAN